MARVRLLFCRGLLRAFDVAHRVRTRGDAGSADEVLLQSARNFRHVSNACIEVKPVVAAGVFLPKHALDGMPGAGFGALHAGSATRFKHGFGAG